MLCFINYLFITFTFSHFADAFFLKATYNWGIHKAINLFMMKSSSVERDEFSVVA